MTTTLTAHREKLSWFQKITILKDDNGKVRKIFNGVNQIRKGQPKIALRGKEYLINWQNADKF